MATDPVYLRDYSCFHSLSDEHLKAIAQITDTICYLPGHVLFEEGQPGTRLFFLIKGDVEVFYNIGEAGQARVDTVSGEEVVGCSALVEPYTYAATERSLTETEVLEVDAVALRELMKKDCTFGFLVQQHIIGILMKRILDLRLSTTM